MTLYNFILLSVFCHWRITGYRSYIPSDICKVLIHDVNNKAQYFEQDLSLNGSKPGTSNFFTPIISSLNATATKAGQSSAIYRSFSAFISRERISNPFIVSPVIFQTLTGPSSLEPVPEPATDASSYFEAMGLRKFTPVEARRERSVTEVDLV